jgi:ankyrin repeat protein
MRTLVKLGVKALPVLLEHLNDKRPTKIIIAPGDFVGAISILKDEDDAKDLPANGYTVMVGDLCYVAIGKIVNRDYLAMHYYPTGNLFIKSVPNCKMIREDLIKRWSNLTLEKHRDSLVHDLLDSRDEWIRNGASVRLAHYYPDALESAALKQLARPFYSVMKVNELVLGPLYAANTAKERKAIVDDFAAKHGEISRDGIRWRLFWDLKIAEDDAKGFTPPGLKYTYAARQCLIDAFGLPASVKSSAGPPVEPLSSSSQARFIETLHYDSSKKLDEALRSMLAKTDDDHIAETCLNRLVGRGYDDIIEGALKQRLVLAKGRARERLLAYERKLGWNRLHAAVDLGKPDLVDQALMDKVPVDARGRDGRTALHIATSLCNEPIVRMLLEADANPNIKDGKGDLAVELAADEDRADIVRMLVAKKSEIPNVLVAAIVGDAERLRQLLKNAKEAAQRKNQCGKCPLHLAVVEGHIEATRALIAAGADVNATDYDKVNYPYGFGWTPLHFAVRAGRTAIAKLLLDLGADVNFADLGKRTPLHHAAFSGNLELVTLLLERQADRTLRDSDNRTALDLAKEEEHTAVIKLLAKGMRE